MPKQIHIATLQGDLQTLPVKDYTSPAQGFDAGSAVVDPELAAAEAYFYGREVPRNGAPTPAAAADVHKASTAGAMAVIDASEEASLCILQRDGVYYVSLSDESLVWDIYYPMRGAFHIWLLSRVAGDRIVFDPYEGLCGATTAFEFGVASGFLSAIQQSPADTCTRINGLTAGVSALLALVTDKVCVGQFGTLVLSPVLYLTAARMDAVYEPFLIDLYQRAQAAGLLLEEECRQLLESKHVVTLSRQMLLERGCEAL